MTNLDDFMVGECMQMCSKKEMEMREKEKLLHVLEMVPGTEKSKTPKADTKRMVKCFSRSAAGKQIPQAYNLRPPDVLLKTVNYLLCEVVDANFPWHVIYDFVEDRLRAVRQDMVIQNVSLAESICLLQPIVRFYAYSTYKLCKEDLSKFDPVLNNKQLQECLKKLLSFYDEYDILLNKVHNTTNDVRCNSFLKQIRPEFEALYLIFNLGNSEALKRICTLSKIYRGHVNWRFFLGFGGKLIQLKKHYFIARAQSKHLKDCKDTLSKYLCIVWGDFFENFSWVVQDEIQSFHWVNPQVTLHPYVYFYIKDNDSISSRSLCIINDDLNYNTSVVHAFQKHLIEDVKQVAPDENKIIYVSDGASSQCKNKKSFVNICHHKSTNTGNFNISNKLCSEITQIFISVSS